LSSVVTALAACATPAAPPATPAQQLAAFLEAMRTHYPQHYALVARFPRRHDGEDC
jgi:hypothetical protein